MKAADLIRIMQFGDSALPVGAFTFSNGVESAIQTGVVHDAETLKGFVRTALKQAASGDGIAVVAAHRAVLAGDNDAILRVDRAVNNRKLNEEARLMATRMGKNWRKFLSIFLTIRSWHGGWHRLKAGTPGHPACHSGYCDGGTGYRRTRSGGYASVRDRNDDPQRRHAPDADHAL